MISGATDGLQISSTLSVASVIGMDPKSGSRGLQSSLVIGSTVTVSPPHPGSQKKRPAQAAAGTPCSLKAFQMPDKASRRICDVFIASMQKSFCGLDVGEQQASQLTYQESRLAHAPPDSPPHKEATSSFKIDVIMTRAYPPVECFRWCFPPFDKPRWLQYNLDTKSRAWERSSETLQYRNYHQTQKHI